MVLKAGFSQNEATKVMKMFLGKQSLYQDGGILFDSTLLEK